MEAIFASAGWVADWNSVLTRKGRTGGRAPPRTPALLIFLAAQFGDRAHGAEFVADGWQINLDTSVSAGTLVRTSPKDPRFIGVANGGLYRTPNADDGTLNFATPSIVAAPFKITEELQAKRDDYGVFVRATGFWDPIYDGGIRPDFHPLPRATIRDVGFDFRLLDAFVFGTTSVGHGKIAWRVGNQVINWGESIFILGGINSAVPFDANALERPGAELREAVLPFPAIDVRADIAENISIEAFYEVYWTRTRFEPVGSFFSTNDSVSDGATYSVLDRSFPDNTSGLQKFNLATNDAFGAVLLRTTDRHPPNQGEFGVALRSQATFLSDAELGLYFENYHSRTPFVGYRTGTLAAALANERLIFTGHGSTYNSSAALYDDYPADIRLLGASFSTSVFGIGLQGEVSHRFNQPLILATPDAVLALEAPYLCRLGADLAALGLGALGAPAVAACDQARRDPVTAAAGGLPGFATSFPQYKRFPVSQAQVSATRQMSPIPSLAIAGWTLVGEIGVNYIHDYPHENGLFDSSNASNASSSFATAATLSGTTQKKGRVTQAAAGGVVAALADLPNLLPYGVDMQPYVALFDGFAGRDAIGAGVFQEGQAAVSLGASFNYLQRIRLTIQYTNHFGFGPTTYYPLVDRDFASVALAYNF